MRIKDGNLVSAPCFVRHGKRTEPIRGHYRQHEQYYRPIRHLPFQWHGLRLSENRRSFLVASLPASGTVFQNERLHHPYRQAGRRNHAICFLEKHTADVGYSRTGADRQLRRKGQHLPLLKRQLPLCGDHGRQSYPESAAQRKNDSATDARNERVLIHPL